MRTFSRAIIVSLFGLLFPPWTLPAQPSLSASSTTALTGSAVSLDLTFAAPDASAIAALQWTITPPPALPNISIAAGPALTAQGKTLSCGSANGFYTCVAYGMNTNVIRNGVVATISGIVSGPASQALAVGGTLGADTGGNSAAVYGSPGTITVLAPVNVDSLSCNPASLGPGAAASCVITLSSAAVPPGATVAITTTGSVTAPSTVTIAAGSSTGAAVVTAGQFATDQSATVSATLNGSVRTATIPLDAPALVSSLQCAPAALPSNATAACTVTLSKAADSGGALVSISGAIPNVLSLPATVIVPPGAAGASFAATTATVPSDQKATVTASLAGSSKTAALSLSGPPLISVFQCAPATLAPNSSTICTVILTKPAPAAGADVTISGGIPTLTVPASVTISPNGTTATFTAATAAVPTPQTITLTAAYGASSATTTLSVTSGAAITLTSLICSPVSVRPASSGGCVVNLSAATASTTLVSLRSSNVGIQVPASVTVAAGAASAAFTFVAGPTLSGWLIIVATLGSSSKSATLTIAPPATTMNLTCAQPSESGGTAVCEVSLQPPPATPVRLRVSSGSPLVGVPDIVRVRARQRAVRFEALIQPAAAPEIATLNIALDDASAAASIPIAAAPNARRQPSTPAVDGFGITGAPELDSLANVAGPTAPPACTPGSAAALNGRFFSNDREPVFDGTGAAHQLSGSEVWVNGATAALLFASSNRIDFVCPDEPPGTALEIVVRRGVLRSQPIATTIRAAAPGLLTLNSSGQALAFRTGSSEIAAIANPLFDATPAVAGDSVSLLATGIDCDESFRDGRPQIEVGSHVLWPSAVRPATGYAGVCELTFIVPPGISEERAPVRLRVLRHDGALIESNSVRIAVDDPR